MVFIFKDPGVWENEIFIAIGTYITSLTGYFIITKLRHISADRMDRLNILSTTDTLTKLYNKKAFEDLCNKYFQ